VSSADSGAAADYPIRPARREEIDAAAGALAAAFDKEPIFTWLMRDDRHRTSARLRFFKVILNEAAFPDGDIERPEDGGAAAVWIPSEKLTGQPLHREIRALPMLINTTGFARFNRLFPLRSSMDAHHPMERAHDYLWFLGVHPDLQGKGVGSRLLASKTERLDARGRAGFLETADVRNLPLYLRYGFEIVSQYQPRPDGPLIYAMWREPRTG
jgi:ribosomal protein S18 acetylase RimI-like enzyme